MLEEAEVELARIRKDYGNSAQVLTHVMIGPPVPKLVEYATQQQIDLILLATHGPDRHRASNDRKRGREAAALRAVLGPGLPAEKALSGIETGQTSGTARVESRVVVLIGWRIAVPGLLQIRSDL